MITEGQNARLNDARYCSGLLFDAGDITGLEQLAATLAREAGAASGAYSSALKAEAAMITDSIRFLEAEWRATNGEAVAYG